MVEWKKLGEVEDSGILTLGRGQVISKIDMNDCPGDFPVYSSSSQNNGEIGRYGKYMFDDERITWSIDGGGKLFYRNGLKYSVTNVCGWLKVNDGNKLNTKFLYYLLFEEWTNIIFDYNHKAHPSVIRNEYQIPIIPLEEQTRIVGILDTFTSAIDNLKEQIAQRRKQYEYYRDQLLDLEGKPGVEMKTLGEVCDFIRGPFGGALKKDIFVSNGYAIYEQQHAIYGVWNFRYFIDENKYNQMKRFKVEAGDILMSCSGTMGKTSIVPYNYKEGIINQALLKLSTKDDISNKYLKQFMDSQLFQDALKGKTAGGAIQNVASVSVLKDLTISLPSLSEQQRIVSILDTFEASIQNLEAQLKQREKQYEYYRNKLLTFE